MYLLDERNVFVPEVIVAAFYIFFSFATSMLTYIS
jgi:hypothetical protein